MISLLPAARDKRIVVLDVGLGTPVRHIVAFARENIAPLNVGAIPTTKLVPWLCLCSGRQDRTIGIFPDVINQTQIMTSLDQVSLRMVGQLLQNLIATACDQILMGLIRRHDLIPFLVELAPRLDLRPSGHRVLPIQVIAFVQRNAKRISLRCSIRQKGQQPNER